MGASLALQGRCKFFPNFKSRFCKVFYREIGTISAPQNTPVSSNFQPDFYSKTTILANFKSNLLILCLLSSQCYFSATSPTSHHFPVKFQNRLKCPKFRVSFPWMTNYTSSTFNSIVAHPTPQIWAFFIQSPEQTFWQTHFF